MISLTVTDLDQFRRYRDDEEMPLADLLKRLRREEGPNDLMRAGTALHAILEHPPADVLTIAERDGHRFHFTLDAELPTLPLRELYGKRTYIVNGEAVEVRGKTDAASGLVVEDHKFTTSQFDAEKHFSAYQWRLYLSIFGADTFVYNVFPAKLLGTDDQGVMDWEVYDFHRLRLYRYPELEADVCRELGQYVAFAQQHLNAA